MSDRLRLVEINHTLRVLITLCWCLLCYFSLQLLSPARRNGIYQLCSMPQAQGVSWYDIWFKNMAWKLILYRLSVTVPQGGARNVANSASNASIRWMPVRMSARTESFPVMLSRRPVSSGDVYFALVSNASEQRPSAQVVMFVQDVTRNVFRVSTTT
jgi:hypothetical protein